MKRLTRQLAAALERSLAGGAPVIPEAGRLLWSMFAELSAARGHHLAGPNAISHADIAAWATLNRWPLAPHHVAVIRALDAAWMRRVHAQPQNGAGRGGDGGKAPAIFEPRWRSSQPVTAAIFDAVFG